MAKYMNPGMIGQYSPFRDARKIDILVHWADAENMDEQTAAQMIADNFNMDKTEMGNYIYHTHGLDDISRVPDDYIQKILGTIGKQYTGRWIENKLVAVSPVQRTGKKGWGIKDYIAVAVTLLIAYLFVGMIASVQAGTICPKGKSYDRSACFTTVEKRDGTIEVHPYGKSYDRDNTYVIDGDKAYPKGKSYSRGYSWEIK